MRGRLTGGCRKKISREGLSLCHAQFNGSGPGKRIMGETSIKGFYSRAIMDKARVVRAGLVWWSQRDLNPCFNHAHVFAMFFYMNDFELWIHGHDLNTQDEINGTRKLMVERVS
jgi:hypothetical protein